MAVGSFSAALSGLNANSEALSVIGNNLANINTTGFKASQVQFRDLVYELAGANSDNPAQIGLGVGVAAITPVFSQGSIESSRVATNAAIQGNGFFLLNGPDGPSYTRAGAFTFDASGTLVSPDGQKVQGYTTFDPVTKQLINSGAPTDIVVPPSVLRPPVASTQFSATTNLNAQAAVGDTFSSAIQVYDSLGQAHVTTMKYTNTGPGAWNYELSVDGAEVSGGTPGTPTVLKTGTLSFDGSGALTTVDGGAPANVSITTPAWTNGATASTLSWNVLSAGSSPLLTGFAAPSATSSITQDGMPAGTVTNISISSDGSIVATIGAGQTITIGQIALVTFNNPEGLIKIGSNRFGEGPEAGVRNIGVAGTGGRGTLIGAALEESNVDMAQEFTQMILAQRGYQANGKMVTVSDQLLLDTINMKQ
ncbi:MAG TPA: flagellar hook protein FlgE [Vicinamibacterales bacterium]